jgi:malonyl-CoA O-methyltransferase
MRLLRRKSSSPSLLSSLDAYARWAERYPPYAHNALMQLEEDSMRRLMPSVKGLTILDLAGGTGRYGLIAERGGAHQVISMDNSLPMLHANPLRGRIAAALDLTPLPDASMDGIICGLAVGHVRDLSPVFAEISRLLKHDGWALISDFHPFAFLSGGKRTFTDAHGRVQAVEHYPHLYSDFHRAAHSAQLTIDAMDEPHLSGKDAPANMQGVPVVLIMRFRR